MRTVALALFAIAWAFAAEAAAPDVMSAVPGHPGLRYFDLMKLAVPDLAPVEGGGAAGHQAVPLKTIGTQQPVAAPPDIKLDFVETLTIPDDPTRLLVLADLGAVEGEVAHVNALALFQLDPSPRLIDVVDVGNDRSASFSGAPTALLAPKSPLILVASGHSNSNQSYLSTQMIFLRDDRLRLIDSVFTFSDNACAFDRKQGASLTLAPSPGPYRALEVEVLETVTPTGADCGSDKPPPAGKKAWRAAYRWDAKARRFVTKSKQLDELFKIDMKRI